MFSMLYCSMKIHQILFVSVLYFGGMFDMGKLMRQNPLTKSDGNCALIILEGYQWR